MTAKDVASKLDGMRPGSREFLEILKLIDQNKLTNQSIVECLKDDSALGAKVLRACNSSHYGFTGSIVTVDQAVKVLDLDLIVPIVLTLSLEEVMSTPMDAYGFAEGELWRHSIATAVVAETFARDQIVPNMNPSAAFASGLMHDVGKAALARILAPNLLAAVREQITKEGLAWVEAERAVLGTDHAEVGAFLIAEWGVRPSFVETVAKHHKPVLKPKPEMSALVCISDLVVHLAGSAPGLESYAIKIDSELVKELKLTTVKADSLLLSARESFGRVKRFVETT